MADLRGLFCALFVLGIGLTTCVAGAEIYRWTDSSGKMHFTQDLGRVPQDQRSAAKSRAAKPASGEAIQHYTAPSPPGRISPTRRGARSRPEGTVHRIRVQQAGASMRVMVRINDTLDVPFIIDTGATDVVIPMFAAKELGLAVEGPGVRTSPRSTANGLIDAPVVMLDSVQLGTAIVRDVGGIALRNMSMGLLGLSFFNHFTYSINAKAGRITLTENNLAESGVLRRGRARSQWTSEFARIHQQIDRAEDQIDDVPFGRSREREHAEDRIAKIRAKLQILESEADDARVPFSWRD